MIDTAGNGSTIPPEVCIRPWDEGDLFLLRRMNTEQMWAHLGGPETEEAVRKRHERYLQAIPGKIHMFAVMVGTEAAGNVGYWKNRWKDQDIQEVGWGVLPEFQGQGIATLAMSALLDIVRFEAPRAVLHAFPSIGNPASNAICRKLGFTHAGETEFEFPKGTWMTCNAWRLAL